MSQPLFQKPKPDLTAGLPCRCKKAKKITKTPTRVKNIPNCISCVPQNYCMYQFKLVQLRLRYLNSTMVPVHHGTVPVDQTLLTKDQGGHLRDLRDGKKDSLTHNILFSQKNRSGSGEQWISSGHIPYQYTFLCSFF